MVDEYEKVTGDTTRASFTGKTLANGGSEGREAATGRGGVIALHELLMLQGFGNVGEFFATVAQDEQSQWKFVAISDSSATLHSENGIDATQAVLHKEAEGRLEHFDDPEVKVKKRDAILSLDVDVLVLAALGDAVTEKI